MRSVGCLYRSPTWKAINHPTQPKILCFAISNVHEAGIRADSSHHNPPLCYRYSSSNLAIDMACRLTITLMDTGPGKCRQTLHAT